MIYVTFVKILFFLRIYTTYHVIYRDNTLCRDFQLSLHLRPDHADGIRSIIDIQKLQINKSAITDHATTENYIINLAGVMALSK